MNTEHVLDPLWITRGIKEFDSEYYKYVILSANKKWRDQLESNDYSGFYEVLFHSLNLNNLAVEGSMFDFKLNPIWDDPKFKEIRKHLRNLYNLPEEVIEIFKNTNYTLTRLIVDYLDQLLDEIGNIKIYFSNSMIHNQKEVFMIMTNLKDPHNCSVWKIRFDKRLKFGFNIEKVDDISISNLNSDEAVIDALKYSSNPDVDKMDPNRNVMIISYDQDQDPFNIAQAISYSIIFSRGIVKSERFHPEVLEELRDILATENVMPFTIKSWK
jgi:hypothetical protein